MASKRFILCSSVMIIAVMLVITSPSAAGSVGFPADVNAKHDQWCIAKPDASLKELADAQDYICTMRMDCTPFFKDTSPCFGGPKATYENLTWFLMNRYYKKHVPAEPCNFKGVGILTSTDPSYGACKFD